MLSRLVLEGLQDWDDHTRNGTRGTIQRMGKLQVSLRVNSWDELSIVGFRCKISPQNPIWKNLVFATKTASAFLVYNLWKHHLSCVKKMYLPSQGSSLSNTFESQRVPKSNGFQWSNRVPSSHLLVVLLFVSDVQAPRLASPKVSFIPILVSKCLAPPDIMCVYFFPLLISQRGCGSWLPTREKESEQCHTSFQYKRKFRQSCIAAFFPSSSHITLQICPFLTNNNQNSHLKHSPKLTMSQWFFRSSLEISAAGAGGDLPPFLQARHPGLLLWRICRWE